MHTGCCCCVGVTTAFVKKGCVRCCCQGGLQTCTRGCKQRFVCCVYMCDTFFFRFWSDGNFIFLANKYKWKILKVTQSVTLCTIQCLYTVFTDLYKGNYDVYLLFICVCGERTLCVFVCVCVCIMCPAWKHTEKKPTRATKRARANVVVCTTVKLDINFLLEL